VVRDVQQGVIVEPPPGMYFEKSWFVIV